MKHLILILLLTVAATAKPKLTKENQLIHDVLLLQKGSYLSKININSLNGKFVISILYMYKDDKPKEKDVKALLKKARKAGFNIARYNYKNGSLAIGINKVKTITVNLD